VHDIHTVLTVRMHPRLVIERAVLILSLLALAWIVARTTEAPFAERALIYDADTDSLYYVTLAPAPGLSPSRRLWLGYTWRDRRVIDDVVGRVHLASVVHEKTAMREALERDPVRWADSALGAIMQEHDAVMAEPHARGPAVADTFVIESGVIAFRGSSGEPRPHALLAAIGEARLGQDDLVPIAFTIQRYAAVAPFDFAPRSDIVTIGVDVRVVARGFLVQGRASSKLHEWGVWFDR
jgi:hypothetical protein